MVIVTTVVTKNLWKKDYAIKPFSFKFDGQRFESWRLYSCKVHTMAPEPGHHLHKFSDSYKIRKQLTSIHVFNIKTPFTTLRKQTSLKFEPPASYTLSDL